MARLQNGTAAEATEATEAPAGNDRLLQNLLPHIPMAAAAAAQVLIIVRDTLIPMRQKLIFSFAFVLRASKRWKSPRAFLKTLS